MKKLKKKDSVVKNNTSITRVSGGEQYPIKEGVPVERYSKKSSEPVVGCNIGMTLNMGNYESLRVDVWLSDTIKRGETPDEAYARILEQVNKTLSDVVSEYKAEED